MHFDQRETLKKVSVSSSSMNVSRCNTGVSIVFAYLSKTSRWVTRIRYILCILPLRRSLPLRIQIETFSGVFSLQGNHEGSRGNERKSPWLQREFLFLILTFLLKLLRRFGKYWQYSSKLKDSFIIFSFILAQCVDFLNIPVPLHLSPFTADVVILLAAHSHLLFLSLRDIMSRIRRILVNKVKLSSFCILIKINITRFPIIKFFQNVCTCKKAKVYLPSI